MDLDDYTDEISELVEEAHATTVSEVMDMNDRQSQEDLLNKFYNNPKLEAIDLYLDVVKRLRCAAYGRMISL